MNKNCSICNQTKPEEDFRLIKETRTKSPTFYLCSICRLCERIKALGRYHDNKEVMSEKNKVYKRENVEKINLTRRKYTNELMKNPINRLKRNLRCLISSKLKNIKNNRSSVYLGTSIETIKKWIDYNLYDDMTWDNYGKDWHIDHTIPIDLFNMEEDGINLCFCWMNLMPLPSHINLKKSNKLNRYRVFYQETQLRKFKKDNPEFEEEISSHIEQYSKKFKLLLLD